MAWVVRPSSLIKRERRGGEVQALKVRLQMLIKVENVLQEQISEIDLNHYRICSSLFKGCKGSVQTRDLFVFHLFFSLSSAEPH
jgi:hypothetical protein